VRRSFYFSSSPSFHSLAPFRPPFIPSPIALPYPQKGQRRDGMLQPWHFPRNPKISHVLVERSIWGVLIVVIVLFLFELFVVAVVVVVVRLMQVHVKCAACGWYVRGVEVEWASKRLAVFMESLSTATLPSSSSSGCAFYRQQGCTWWVPFLSHFGVATVSLPSPNRWWKVGLGAKPPSSLDTPPSTPLPHCWCC